MTVGSLFFAPNFRGAGYKYPTLSLEEIKQLDVGAIAAPNCALFFWAWNLATKKWGEVMTTQTTQLAQQTRKKTSPHFFKLYLPTMPMLPEALEVIKVWDFKYKTVAFTWIKTNKKSDTLFWGMGNFTRANSELCLLGMRGKLERMNAGVHSVIQSPVAAHSKKPDVVRDRIVQLFGDLPRIELFARTSISGWDTLGNDIDGQDITEILATP